VALKNGLTGGAQRDATRNKERPSLMHKNRISCVIPCYRSAGTIAEVVGLLEETISSRSDEFDHEIILVNDASPDGGATLAELRRIAETNESVVVVNLARNFGQFPAIMAGFAQVSGDIVVVLDDDMQCPPQEMFRLVDKVVDDDVDIAYAYYPDRKFSAWRNWGSSFNTWCVRHFAGVPRDLQINNYYAVKRYVVDEALRYENPYPYIDGLLIQSVGSYANVEVTHHAREQGSSGYTLRSLIAQWLDGVTLFSIVPLRVASLLGAVFAFVGFVACIVLIVQKVLDPSIAEGWTSLMAVLLLMGGVIILAVGMLGEYVGRIYISINKKPQYVVRDVLDRRGEREGLHD